MDNAEHRYLTVEPFYVDSWPKRIYSLLRLKGRWLHDAGFKPGYTVTVRVAPDEITLFMKGADHSTQSHDEP